LVCPPHRAQRQAGANFCAYHTPAAPPAARPRTVECDAGRTPAAVRPRPPGGAHRPRFVSVGCRHHRLAQAPRTSSVDVVSLATKLRLSSKAVTPRSRTARDTSVAASAAAPSVSTAERSRSCACRGPAAELRDERRQDRQRGRRVVDEVSGPTTWGARWMEAMAEAGEKGACLTVLRQRGLPHQRPA
jgi:hypothetical protein